MTQPLFFELEVDDQPVSVNTNTDLAEIPVTGDNPNADPGQTTNLFEVEVDTDPVGVDVDQELADLVSKADPTALIVGVPGPMGGRGLPGTGTAVSGDTPIGAVDGFNCVFHIAVPYRASSTAVYLNGLREMYYQETANNSITLQDPPQPGDTIFVDYTAQ